MKDGKGSVFTHFVVEGLKGDKAAADNSGNITPDTLGRFVYDKVTSKFPNQRPIRRVSTSGEIILATIPSKRIESGGNLFNIDEEIEKAKNYFNIGEYNEALSSYNLILQNDPKKIEAWNNKGKVYEKLVMYSDALECFNRAFEINSDDDIL